MNAAVKSIKPGSIAAKTKISTGDILCKINNNQIHDVLDYDYYSYDSRLLLEFINSEEKIKLIKINKPEGDDLGIEFESYLMDKERSCVNKCIFCFIDQLPAGMRETLYYKDDDVRLSFFHGNYVTLTNLSADDIKRIIKLRISPINVSIHTLDPKLRSFMLGGSRGATAVEAFKALVKAGITVNCQIVCCPGINTGRELSETIKGLIRLGPGINSVSVVPVGLTKHRQGLTQLCPFDKLLARETIRRVEHYAAKCLKKRGSRVFYCADELFITAGMKLPKNKYYEDYPQLENGVGMMRLFITEIENALKKQKISGKQPGPVNITVITGVSSYYYLSKLIDTIKINYDTITVGIYAIRNDFFGEGVTVSGLVTGGDIIRQLKGKALGKKLLIPENMLKKHTGTDPEDEVFLDDLNVTEVSRSLGIPIQIVKQTGNDFLSAILGF